MVYKSLAEEMALIQGYGWLGPVLNKIFRRQRLLSWAKVL